MKKINVFLSVAAIAGIGVAWFLKPRNPSNVSDIEITEDVKYHITKNQTFGENCIGAMIFGDLYTIKSRTMRLMNAAVGDYIRVYRFFEYFDYNTFSKKNLIIDKFAVITEANGDLFKVNRPLWAGHNNENNPSLRTHTPEHSTPQSISDPSIFHIKVAHLGYKNI